MAGFDAFPLVAPPQPPGPPQPPAPPQGVGGGDPWAAFPVAEAPKATPAPAGGSDRPAMPPGMSYNPETGQVEDLTSPINPHVPTGTANAGIIGGGQGLGFGLFDEAVGGIGGADAAVRSMFGDGPAHGDAGDAYNFYRDTTREADRRAASDSPVTYYGSQIGGALAGALSGGALARGLGETLGLVKAAPVATSALPALTSRAAAPIWQKMATGAGAGTLEGALYGYGSGEGGVGNRVEHAVTGGTIGGVTGGLAPLAIPVVRNVVSAGGNLAGSALRGMGMLDAAHVDPTAAGKVIDRALSRAGKTPGEVDAAITGAAREGQPMYTITDAIGDPAQGALNGVARQPGPARLATRDFLFGRQAGQGDRIGSQLTDALSAPDTAAERTAALGGARDAAADTAYDAARANAGPVDVRNALSVIDARIGGMQGTGVTGDGIDAALSGFRNRLAARNPAASVIPGTTGVGTPGVGPKTAVELSDFGRVLGVKQDLRDAITKATIAGEGNKARELGKLHDAIDAALEDASPEYRVANDEFAKASATMRAVDDGAGATGPRVRTQDALNTIQGLTPEQKAAFSGGYADKLLGAIENGRPGTNKVEPLFSDKNQAILGATAKDPDLLARQLGRERTMALTDNIATKGSSTVNNANDVADSGFLGEIAGQAVTRPTYAISRGLGRLFQTAMNGATGHNEATRADIARALLSSDVGGALAGYYAKANTRAAREAVIAALGRSTATRAAGPQ